MNALKIKKKGNTMKFKKQISLIVLTMMILSSISFTANSFSVSIEGEKVIYDSNTGYPYMNEKGQIMVPLVATLEAAHFDVSWYDDQNYLGCAKEDTEVTFCISESKVIFSISKVLNYSELVLQSGKAYLPLNSLIKLFDYSSEWDEATKTIKIENTNEPLVDGIESIQALKKMIDEKSLDIHAYSTYGYSLEGYTAREKIFVRDLEAPAIILLCGYESIEWTIIAEDPTDIVAVCLEGYHKQTLTNKDFPSYSHYAMADDLYYLNLSDTTCGRIQFAEDVKALYGSELKSLQVWDHVIDGRNTVAIAPKQIDYAGHVVLEHMGDHYDDDHIEHYPLNVAGYTGDHWDSNFKSNQGYLYGKYYFETEITIGHNQGLSNSTNLGISTDTQYNSDSLPNDRGSEGEYAYGALVSLNDKDAKRSNLINSSGLKTGDIVGVAMDLDNNRLYFSLNGKWQNGDPTDKNAGREIKDNRVYYAKASIACVYDGDEKEDTTYDQIKFNFREDSFKYPVPERYLPYDH